MVNLKYYMNGKSQILHEWKISNIICVMEYLKYYTYTGNSQILYV